MKIGAGDLLSGPWKFDGCKNGRVFEEWAWKPLFQKLDR